MRVLLTLLVFMSVPSFGHDYQLKEIKVDHPWARPTPPGSSMGAAYLKIHNDSDVAATLIAVKVSPEIADSAEVHHTLNENGLLKMRHLKAGKTLAPKQVFQLQPGGAHIMLVGLKKPLMLGEKFDLTLVFANQGELKTQVWVENQNEKEGGHKAHHHH